MNSHLSKPLKLKQKQKHECGRGSFFQAVNSGMVLNHVKEPWEPSGMQPNPKRVYLV